MMGKETKELETLIKRAKKGTSDADKALSKGLRDASKVLSEIKKRKKN